MATNRQVRAFIDGGGEALRIDPRGVADRDEQVAHALDWAEPRLPRGPVLVYSTAEPNDVKAAQEALGVDTGRLVEDVLGTIAHRLVECGVRQLVVAGGETAGACVQKLGVEQLQIGPQIDPGVPWCYAHAGETRLHLALKSGNFGADDFFTKAFRALQ